jgi:Fur family transcriptional regulator, ferric uptake regulator
MVSSSREAGVPTPLDRQALGLLRPHGLRCTPGRIAILQVLLAGAPGHLSLAEIHQRVSKLGWPTDNTAVRRSLHAFTRCGLTHALAVPGPLAYGLATPLHHHALCDTCGALTDVTAATLAATLAAAQAATGYVLTLTGLTLPGCCPACQQASPDACQARALQETARDGTE